MEILILEAFTFAWPLWLMNMSYVFIPSIKRLVPFMARLDRPLDFNMQIGGKRVLGDSRPISSLLLTLFVVLIVFASGSDYLLLLKLILVQIATLLSSFVKRRIGIVTGSRLPIVDQADYVILICSIWLLKGWMEFPLALTIFILTFNGQLVMSWIGNRLGFKEKPY